MLVIGGLILVVFNVLRIKERKYDIGVLSAIGMSRPKVALQFIYELFIVTCLAMILSIGVGAVTSVPITNSLLSNQVTSTQNETFGGMGGSGGGPMMRGGPGMNTVRSEDLISEVSSAMDFTVVIQLLGLALLLTIVSGGVATLSVLRYDPQKILSNRE